MFNSITEVFIILTLTAGLSIFVCPISIKGKKYPKLSNILGILLFIIAFGTGIATEVLIDKYGETNTYSISEITKSADGINYKISFKNKDYVVSSSQINKTPNNKNVAAVKEFKGEKKILVVKLTNNTLNQLNELKEVPDE